MAHKMRHSLFLSFSFLFHFSYFCWISPLFELGPGAHVRNCPERSSSIRKEHFLAISAGWLMADGWVGRE